SRPPKKPVSRPASHGRTFFNHLPPFPHAGLCCLLVCARPERLYFLDKRWYNNRKAGAERRSAGRGPLWENGSHFPLCFSCTGGRRKEPTRPPPPTKKGRFQ